MHSPGFSPFKVSSKPHSNKNPIQIALHKIPPLKVFRGNILNSRKLRERFKLKGYKLIQKLSAAGPDTQKILVSLKKSNYLKSVKSFEFDPYLCDESYITCLRTVCHKVSKAKSLNLVIRRMDNPDELETLSPFIARFSRLQSIRVEFPNTQNVSENSIGQLYKAIKKCYFLKSFEWLDIGMPERYQKSSDVSLECTSRLKWLESIKFYAWFKQGAIKNDLHHPPNLKRGKEYKLKSMHMSLSVQSEWGSMETEKGSNDAELFEYLFQTHTQLQKIKVMAMKSFSNTEDIKAFFTAAAKSKALRHFEFECLSCKLEDMDVIMFVQCLMKLKQIEYFSFKVIQYPNVSEEIIEQVARVLSKLDNLKNFDLYFRRLSLPPAEILELGKRIQSLENVECSCSKESIHIYKVSRKKFVNQNSLQFISFGQDL